MNNKSLAKAFFKGFLNVFKFGPVRLSKDSKVDLASNLEALNYDIYKAYKKLNKLGK